MGILQQVLLVFQKAVEFVTTSLASTYAYDAMVSGLNLILKIAASLGLKDNK